MDSFNYEPFSLDLGVMEDLSWNGLPESPLYESDVQCFQEISTSEDESEDLNFESLLNSIKETGEGCSSKHFQIITNSIAKTSILGARPRTKDYDPLSLSCKKFEEHGLEGLRSIPSEVSDFILDISTNNRNEGKPKILDGTRKNGCVSSPLDQNQLDKAEFHSFRTMPSELSEILEMSIINMTQENNLLCFSNINTSGSRDSKVYIAAETVNENDRIMQKGPNREEKNFSLDSTGQESQPSCFEPVSSELFDFILETSNNNRSQQNINKPNSSQCYSHPPERTDSHKRAVECFNTDSKILSSDVNNNNVSKDNSDKTFSYDRQLFLQDFTVLDDNDQLCKSIINPSYGNENAEITISTTNSLCNQATTNSDHISLNNLPVIEIMGTYEQKNTGKNSESGDKRWDSKEQDQPNKKPLYQMKDLALEAALGQSAESEFYHLRTDPHLRAHRDHINRMQRMRIKKLNDGYKCLHAALPSHLAKQKLSRLEILLQAVKYIRYLDNILLSCENTKTDVPCDPKEKKT